MEGSDQSFLLFVGVLIMAVFWFPVCDGFTDQQDVYAINNMYVALGSPSLPGWIPNGGDPCTESWLGVQCVDTNITAIILNGLNLGGQLGDTVGNFTSIITLISLECCTTCLLKTTCLCLFYGILLWVLTSMYFLISCKRDLSNNHIGGSIPENLPPTMMKFSLSSNQLMGSLPSTLSELTILSDMSVNDNFITGVLPDAFQSLTSLVSLDLSSNNLTGPLPPSMESLLSLTTLLVQNNQLSGTLDALQDLPLKELNIENNLFSGLVPEPLLSIPNFKKDGNPLNTTSAPSSMSSPTPPLPPSGASVPESMSANSSADDRIHHGAKGISIKRVVGYVLIAFISLTVMVLATMFVVSKWQKKKQPHEEIPQWQGGRAYEERKEPTSNGNSDRTSNTIEREEGRANGMLKEPNFSTNLIKLNSELEKEAKDPPKNTKKEHETGLTGTDALVMPPLPGKVTVKPIVPSACVSRDPAQKMNLPTSVKSFSVASLQQYTNSFREENLIRDGRFGNIYLAVLPDGKELAVMKLDNVYSRMPIDEFSELVSSISELQHPNILELVGYCSEFEQRLLIYDYFNKRTLHDILHSSDILKRKLSWKARIQVALGAAKALEYLHEGCKSPIVHQNFEPSNVLIDDELSVRVSECGLASLISFSSVTRLSGRLRAILSYEAPEINESGSHTDRSDVYSFGVVMLELLTGRKPYDSLRPRAEQHLVRWASSQLYDINALSRMVDPSIEGRYPVKSLSRFADIISCCILQGPEFRPPMSQVVQDLSRLLDGAADLANGGTLVS